MLIGDEYANCKKNRVLVLILSGINIHCPESNRRSIDSGGGGKPAEAKADLIRLRGRGGVSASAFDPKHTFLLYHRSPRLRQLVDSLPGLDTYTLAVR